PALDADGYLTFPGASKDDERLVESLCATILQELPPPPGQEAYQGPSEEDIQALRDFADCFRANGIPEFPDPAADGTFPIDGTPLEQEVNGSSVAARVQEARPACVK